MTKLGRIAYQITIKAGCYLIKHLKLYYILLFTWGLPLTLVGLITTGVLKALGKQPKKFLSTWYIPVGKHWGGLELGCCFIVDESEALSTLKHETGHTFQNAIFGVFTIFIEFIPSAIRYWTRKVSGSKKPYDSIWFEGSATFIGTQFYKERNK